MKNLSLLLIAYLLLFSCSQENQANNIDSEPSAQTETTVETSETERRESISYNSGSSGQLRSYKDSVFALPNKTVLDYYYLLPSDPYFAMEVGTDNLASRRAGLKYQNVRNGYLKGGHEYGPSFNMALFRVKGDINKKDYLLVYRIQYIGSMFRKFFHLLELREGNWVSIPSELTEAASKYRANNLEDFTEEEYVIPIIPEHGTTVKFAKCNLNTTSNCEDSETLEVLFAYTWDGKQFELKSDIN